MTEYIKQPVFWFSVIIVAFLVNMAYNYFTKKGKLI